MKACFWLVLDHRKAPFGFLSDLDLNDRATLGLIFDIIFTLSLGGDLFMRNFLKFRDVALTVEPTDDEVFGVKM